MLLGPARVHAKQHARPILAFGAAGAGMDFEIGIQAVGLAGQQGLHLAPAELGLDLLESLFGFGDDLLILLGFAEFDQHQLVVQLPLDPADGGELVLERGALLHRTLGARAVVPEARVFRLLVQLCEARLGLVEVKDASSAVQRTA